jgi:membrane protein
VTRTECSALVCKVWDDINRTRTTSIAGGLVYFFLLSLFPMLIVAATMMGYLPVPNLFERGVDVASGLVPPDAMGVVRGTLASVLKEQHAGLLSLGIIGAIWSASGGFSSMIDCLDIAYDVKQSRSYIRQRVLAIGLTFAVGGLFTIALIASVLGPQFGDFLSKTFHVQALVARLWPAVRWGAIFVSVVIAIELLYFLGPNVKQRFMDTLPGAILATAVWLLASLGLGLYISHFGNYNKTYGSLGAVIALMLWLYVTSIIIIVGAEVNSELVKMRGDRLAGQSVEDKAEVTKVVQRPKAA